MQHRIIKLEGASKAIEFYLLLCVQESKLFVSFTASWIEGFLASACTGPMKKNLSLVELLLLVGLCF